MRSPALWALAGQLLLAACAERAATPALSALPDVPIGTGTVPPRVNGPLGTTDAPISPQVTFGVVRTVPTPQAGPNGAPAGRGATGGDVSLDFADTDIREIVAQVLGNLLRVNYTIDPAVRGTATLRTVNPISRTQLLPALQALLAQNGATLTQAGDLYRVVPTSAAAASPGLAGGAAVTGGTILPLRYASAEDLAKTLQPFVGTGGKVVADAGRNVLLVSGDPQAREAILALAGAFDIDVLAGQSYALFPVTSGGAKDFASALSDAFRSGAGAALAGVVRVVPMERVNAVLIVSSQPRYIDEARRVYSLIERARRQTVRSWNVYYLQNGRSNDVAYVLQQAFTPGHVTAQPTPAGGLTASGRGSDRTSGFNNGATGSGLNPGGPPGSGSIGGSRATPGTINTTPASSPSTGTQQASGDTPQSSANPLFGGLDPTAAGPGGGADANAIRIIPNSQNNAILIYATAQERETVEAMLRKIDILPLQVRIDATIAEVDLNDQLQYGTQFFFKAGINGALNFSPAGTALGTFASALPGFTLSGPNGQNAALNALQAVTTIKVLSSPQVLVLDNETARLQVGNLVPFLTTSQQSVISANAPVVNSIDYRQTGVILEVTPRVNSGGLVTLDISQEVSDVVPATSTTSNSTGINSPTFSTRNVSSRVVVQDGQTIGLAGLIRDNVSTSNEGIPFLKDIPLLGLLAGSQDNTRTRTELLILITPRVVHDQRDARALTEDLRDELINAATVPDELRRLRPTGSTDPSAPLRRSLRLQPR